MSTAALDAPVTLDEIAETRRVRNRPVATTRPPSLDDPQQYRTIDMVPLGEDPPHFTPIRKVAILDTYKVEGKGEANEAYLALLIKNTMARIARGEYPVITFGHFIEKAPETELPPIVGYLANLVLGTYHDKPCILADLHIAVEHYADAVTYPRRSVEMWQGIAQEDNYVDSIALLRRSPERQLGLITHTKQATETRWRIRFCRDEPFEGTADADTQPPLTEARDMTAEELTAAISAANEPLVAMLKEMHAAALANAAPATPEDDDATTKMEAGVAGGDNTFVPDEVKAKDDDDDEKTKTQMGADCGKTMENDDKKVQMSKTETVDAIAALTRQVNDVVTENKSLRTTVAAQAATISKLERYNDGMTVKFQLDDIERKVQGLIDEGVQIIDPEAEVTALAALPAELRDGQFQRMKTQYRRVDLRRPMIQVAEKSGIGSTSRTDDFRKGLQDYCVANRITDIDQGEQLYRRSLGQS